MSIVLACITDRSDLALQVASLLTRSNIAVNIRIGVPESHSQQPPAPFEIILLATGQNPPDTVPDQVKQAMDWFMVHQAHRYWIVHDASIKTKAFTHYQHIADAMASQLHPDDVENDAQIERLIVHGQYNDEVCPSQSCNSVPVNCLSQAAVDSGHVSLFNDLKLLADTRSRHAAVTVRDADAMQTLIRASERVKLLAGNPRLALHLPALLRLRGWLGSNLQLEKNPPSRISLPDPIKPAHAIQLINHEKNETVVEQLQKMLAVRAMDTPIEVTITQPGVACEFLQFPYLEWLHLGHPGQAESYPCIACVNAYSFKVDIPLNALMP